MDQTEKDRLVKKYHELNKYLFLRKGKTKNMVFIGIDYELLSKIDKGEVRYIKPGEPIPEGWEVFDEWKRSAIYT